MELIECIERIPSLLDKIIINYQETEKKICDYICQKQIEEIVYIASGTSLNYAKVTKYFADNKLGIKTRFIYPNEFVNYDTYKNDKAIYVFVSQGGSTKLVYDALNIVKEIGYMNISITESLESPIAKSASVSIEMGSEHEEFMYRTIGYSCTVINCYLIEMIISKYMKYIDY